MSAALPRELASALLLAKVGIPVDEMRLAMAIGGTTVVGLIGRAAWETQAKAARLRPGRVIDVARDVALRLPAAAEAVAARAAGAGVDERFTARFAKQVSGRAIACARSLEARA